MYSLNKNLGGFFFSTIVILYIRPCFNKLVFYICFKSVYLLISFTLQLSLK